jgi:hypothetical protein
MRDDPAKPDACGRPTYFTWLGPDLGIALYPAPDAEYDLRILYYGRLQEA